MSAEDLLKQSERSSKERPTGTYTKDNPPPSMKMLDEFRKASSSQVLPNPLQPFAASAAQAASANDSCENDVLSVLASFSGRSFQADQVCSLLRKKNYSIEDVEAALIELDRKKLVVVEMVPMARVSDSGEKISRLRKKHDFASLSQEGA